jgi:crossover junction endodeoxyribonuclease RuvC
VRILGIDPGTRATGFGVVDFEGSSLRRVAGGVIRPRSPELPGRLRELYVELEQVIAEFKPEGTALEAVFTARNPRSALLLGHARGVALVACAAAGLSPAEYSPGRVKQAVVGYGNASKSQVQRMVQRLLALPTPPPADEADALAVAICHGHSRPPETARRRLPIVAGGTG